MTSKKVTLTLALAMLITACSIKPYGGTFNFTGPETASNQDFIDEFYSCAKEATGNTSNSSADLTVELRNGANQSYPSCSMMRLCLAKKGFLQDDNGRFDSKPIAVACIQ
jgi:hypothetical protein